MLYINFEIKDPSKYADFQKLYDHMVATRQVGFEFENEAEPDEQEYDWENMTDEEFQKIDDSWSGGNTNIDNPKNTAARKRYQQVIPDYADRFLASYVGFDNSRAGEFSFELLDIFNYLEVSFEVDMTNLEKYNNGAGIVEFSTGNYPYGGMERFLITLKAFDLIPTECFNGFTVYEFDWTSAFSHEAIELPEKTKEYLGKFK